MLKKLVGRVTHFFPKAGVAVVEFKGELSVGEKICVEGASTLFYQAVESMEVDKQKVERVSKDAVAGVKLADRARAGDSVYKIVE